MCSGRWDSDSRTAGRSLFAPRWCNQDSARWAAWARQKRTLWGEARATVELWAHTSARRSGILAGAASARRCSTSEPPRRMMGSSEKRRD